MNYNFSYKCRNIFTYKLSDLMSGYHTILVERLVISGHFSSTIGKYFEKKEATKHKEFLRKFFYKTADGLDLPG